MPKLRVLYYPTFEPPELWLRSFLLFFDEINTIVPTDAGFKLSDQASRIVELMPDAFATISPTEEDIEIDKANLRRLRKAFSQIAGALPSDREESISFEIDPDGAVRIAGHVFLHYSKTSREVYDLLQEFELIKTELATLPQAFGLPEGYSVVNEDASLLLLSHIADRIGDRSGITTITDQTLNFTVNALNALKTIDRSDSATKLASSIVSLEIPHEVLVAEPKRFRDIRDAYQDIRIPFQKMTQELAQLYRLDFIGDQRLLQERISEIARGFDAELQSLKKSALGRKVKRWAPISIGSLATLAGAAIGDPKIVITSAVVSVVVQVIQEFINHSPSEAAQDQVQRLLGKMQKDILKVSEVKRLV